MIFMSGAHGVARWVGVGWGRLGVYGSAVAPPLWRLMALELSCLENTAELGGREFL